MQSEILIGGLFVLLSPGVLLTPVFILSKVYYLWVLFDHPMIQGAFIPIDKAGQMQTPSVKGQSGDNNSTGAKSE